MFRNKSNVSLNCKRIIAEAVFIVNRHDAAATLNPFDTGDITLAAD